MQIFSHNNKDLTIPQLFFIEKSLELLHLGSIDSYRVRLNNPKTVLVELKYCLCEFKKKRIKHFDTIKDKGKDRKVLIDEVTLHLDSEPNYLTFRSISKTYLRGLLTDMNEYNYLKVIVAIEILLEENDRYLEEILAGLELLLDHDDHSLHGLENIDKTLNILFSELIGRGYDKGYLYRKFYATFVHALGMDSSFSDHFSGFVSRVKQMDKDYRVIFRVDTTQKVYDSISTIPYDVFTLTDHIELDTEKRPEFAAFNTRRKGRKFLCCEIKAADYFSALKHARSVLSEYLDIIDLGLSDEYLQIHSRVLVINEAFPERGDFHSNVNILDGKYKVEKDRYLNFISKLPAIINNSYVINETKEKIKSAIRYLRLGNQSTEVEHKFINYWIGLEYLFSNYESQNTIGRIKEHFINAHSLAYVKRNVHGFKRDFSQVGHELQKTITAFNPVDDNYLMDIDFYDQVSSQVLSAYPLLAYRAMKLKNYFFSDEKRGGTSAYVKRHQDNLEMHFTRIYRLRNEIIHDAATNTKNGQITSNLRYYLTFILNELIDYLSKPGQKEKSIETYFTLNEIRLGNIKNNNYLLADLLTVDCSIGFIL